MEILLFIQEHLRCALLDSVFPLITALGNAGIFWIALGVLLTCLPKYRRCGVAVLLSLAVTYVTGDILIKNLVQRPRPFAAMPEIELLIAAPHGFSFPSGHTASSFTAATAIFFHYRKAGIAAYVLAALIAFSRLYLFVHYPGDVLAGMLWGILLAMLVCCQIRKKVTGTRSIS